MQQLPKISVITPSFNQCHYLEETIKSVHSQAYSVVEHIVIDGGSNDGSIDIIKKYTNGIAYWVSEPDQGQAEAINKGFKIAKGEIIAWLNSDDYYLPNTLTTIAHFFNNHPDIDCLFGDLYIVNRESRILYLSRSAPFDFRTMLYGGARVPQPATFFRSRVLSRVGLLDINLHYSMDIDFFLRCGLHKVKFAHMPQPLACFRIHDANKTQNVKYFKRETFLVTTRIAGRKFSNDRLQFHYLSFMQFVFRIKAFLQRGFTRKDIIPFKTRWFMWKARRSWNESKLK